MADEANLSKRERQKRRREEKRQRELAAAKRARTTRLAAFAVVGLLVVAFVGVLVRNNLAQRAELAPQEDRVASQLEEFGCTEDAEQPDQGAGHLGNAQLASNPPDTLYPDRPASSGQHIPNWIISGVYDKQIDERLLVHNLEHGYINVYYDDGADEAMVTEIESWAQAKIDGDFQKIIVAPWDGELPDGANVAFAAWNFRQLCEQFSPDVADVFTRAHHGLAGNAPEKNLPPHRRAPDEGIDPDAQDGPLLLPPLGEATGATEEAPAIGEVTEGAPSMDEDGSTEAPDG